MNVVPTLPVQRTLSTPTLEERQDLERRRGGRAQGRRWREGERGEGVPKKAASPPAGCFAFEFLLLLLYLSRGPGAQACTYTLQERSVPRRAQVEPQTRCHLSRGLAHTLEHHDKHLKTRESTHSFPPASPLLPVMSLFHGSHGGFDPFLPLVPPPLLLKPPSLLSKAQCR